MKFSVLFHTEKMFDMVYFICNRLERYSLVSLFNDIYPIVILILWEGKVLTSHLGCTLIFFSCALPLHGRRISLEFGKFPQDKIQFQHSVFLSGSLVCFALLLGQSCLLKDFWNILYPNFFSCLVTFSGLNQVFYFPWNHNFLWLLTDWIHESQCFRKRTNGVWNREVIS